MNDDRITMREVVDAGQCASGQRKWLDKHAPGWRKYVKDGMPIEEARALNAALVERILKHREARRG